MLGYAFLVYNVEGRHSLLTRAYISQVGQRNLDATFGPCICYNSKLAEETWMPLSVDVSAICYSDKDA